MRRRTFAASMVVTFSLAEPGCGHKTSNPPPPEEELSHNPPGVETDAPPQGEPEPEPEPPVDALTPTERIVDNGDGTCSKIVDVDCPPQVACNPPPPRQVVCPPHER